MNRIVRSLRSPWIYLKSESRKQYTSDSKYSRSWKDLSYAQGEASLPLIGATIGELLETTTDKFPDKIAVEFPFQNITKTFNQLYQESNQLAAGLLNIGLERGDRVGIWAPNCYQWILTQYATARAGIIMVNVNPAYQAPELEYALKKVGVKALIMAEEFKTQKYHEILRSVCPEVDKCTPGDIRSARLPDLKTAIVISEKQHRGALKFEDVYSGGTNKQISQIQDLQEKLQFDDPINIQFTSGTTGVPKGATLTHHNITNNAYFLGRSLNYHDQESRICVPVPLYHCFGMVMASLQCAIYAATCVYPAPSFQPDMTLKAVESHKCTALYGTPTMFIDMLASDLLGQLDLSSLRNGIMAGSSCPSSVMQNVIEKMNMKDIIICYGTTENSPVTFFSTKDSPVEKRVSTIGKPGPHVEVKVVNVEGEVVHKGEKGELCTRGYTTMLSYWNDTEKTSKVIMENRWYHTGDVAYLDDEGYGVIVGRIKDMIIRGGENIYPAEVEQVLYTHPKIEDVQVIGVPSRRLGEEVAAWIKLKEGKTANEDDIKQYCKGKISHFKIPKYVHFVKEYPLTFTGKVQKYKIQEHATKILKLEEAEIH